MLYILIDINRLSNILQHNTLSLESNYFCTYIASFLILFVLSYELIHKGILKDCQLYHIHDISTVL
jgi:hypothetical protein